VLAATVPAPLAVLVVLVIGSHLVALSNSRKISVTLLADRHLPGRATPGEDTHLRSWVLNGFMKTEPSDGAPDLSCVIPALAGTAPPIGSYRKVSGGIVAVAPMMRR